MNRSIQALFSRSIIRPRAFSATASSAASFAAAPPPPAPPAVSESAFEGADAAAASRLAAAKFARMRHAIDEHLKRLRRLDSLAVSAAPENASHASLDVNVVTDSQLRFVPPEPGLPIDYCIFCHHGTSGLLASTNTSLLSRFVSDRGALLPRRFTHACVKHQRVLVRTIKRARALNLIPFLSKLHPRARFSSLSPARADAAQLDSRAGAFATALGAQNSPAAAREAAERAVKALTEIERGV